MISLLINEYIKVFKKKGFIILLIIMLAFTLLTNVIYNAFDKLTEVYDSDTYIEEEYNNAKEVYESNRKDRENLEWYVSTKDRYDIYKLKEKYGKDSWQSVYIEKDNEIQDIIHSINSYELKLTKYEEEYNKAKKDYDLYIEKLKNSEWKDIVNEEKKQLEEKIKRINVLIESKSTEQNDKEDDTEVNELNFINDIDQYDELEAIPLKDLIINKKSLEIDLEALNTQLEKNISYADKDKYTQLMNYFMTKQELLQYDGKNIERLSEEQKDSYYILRENYFKQKYVFENNNLNTSITLADIFAEFYENYLLMIVIFVFMIAGPIVSQEFSKGTIKLLLVKPYSRTKILLSKYIVVLSSIFMAIAIMFVFQLIVGGLFFGFDSLSDKVVIYSNVTDSAKYIHVLKYFALITIARLPHFIMLATLTFTISSITNNTAVSIITGFVGYIGTNILSELLVNVNKPWVKYFVGFHWNFKPYMFNLKPVIKGIDFKFSVMMCLLYFLVFIIPAFIVFKRKDIKNI